MRRIIFAIPVLVLLFPVSGWCSPDDEDSKLVQGVWLPTKAELGGEKFPEEVLKTMKLTIKDDTYTVNVGDLVDKGTIKRDTKAKPKSIDIIGSEGPNKGKTFLAIYEIKDDTMRICYDLEGKKRPTEFKTDKESKYFLVEYKKSKE